MRVLIADDSDLILDRLHKMLNVYSKVEIVGSYKDGIETLEALKILKPDLAIVDLRMPGLSGLEVLNEIKKEDKFIKFIILTLSSSDYYRKVVIHAGADYFFNKAEDFGKVSLVVASMLWQEIKNHKNKRLII